MSKIRRNRKNRKEIKKSFNFGISFNDKKSAEDLGFEIACDGLLFGGNLKALIPHLRDIHGLSFEEIEIGINDIRKSEGPTMEGWEKYY